MKKKTRILSWLLLAALSLGLLAGCNQSQNGENPSQGGAPGEGSSSGKKDSIIIATMGETPTLTAYGHNATAGSYINQLTYSTLFQGNLDTMQPEPLLVDTYENISDTVWEFKLKEGIKYHNGETMTAEDVKASIEEAQNYAEVSQFNKDIVSIEVVDDLTVRMETAQPDALLLSNLCSHGNAILPKDLLDSGHDFNEQPIGSGPYKFVEWNRGDSLVFEAFEDI